MKVLSFLFALCLSVPCLSCAEELEKSDASATEAKPAVKQTPIKGWGTGVDLVGDCKFNLDGNSLKITVPGSERPHDMSTELHSDLAPRVLQPLKGDFILDVKIEADFDPGDESTQSGRTGYTGAGLVVFADPKNYVRLERATLHSGSAHPYTNFEIRVDGELERIGTTADLPTVEGKPVWLRLQRQGNILRGFMSQDGKTWKEGEPKVLESKAWKSGEVFAGVAAISTSKKEFTPVYSEFSVKGGGDAKAPAPRAEPQTEPELEKK